MASWLRVGYDQTGSNRATNLITRVVPSDWRDLQAQVARILEECGFATELEKTVRAARGSIEIDVYAEETVRGRRYSIVCECKHWKSRIPQSVVHGFRTVVAEIGANAGYVVSRNGYQDGAFKASELTNIELVTWSEFQDRFQTAWFDHHFSPTIAARLDALMTYAEPILPAWFPQLSEDDRRQYFALKDQYDGFGWLMLSFSPYPRMRGEAIPTLPISDRITPESDLWGSLPAHILNETAYRQFLESAITYGESAIQEFRAVRDRAAPNQQSDA